MFRDKVRAEQSSRFEIFETWKISLILQHIVHGKCPDIGKLCLLAINVKNEEFYAGITVGDVALK